MLNGFHHFVFCFAVWILYVTEKNEKSYFWCAINSDPLIYTHIIVQFHVSQRSLEEITNA
jgi:hypothetical protein